MTSFTVGLGQVDQGAKGRRTDPSVPLLFQVPLGDGSRKRRRRKEKSLSLPYL